MEPGLLYTILPAEQIFPPDEPGETEFCIIRGCRCECVRDGERRRICRLFSTNPADYLDPGLAPGSAVFLRDR